MSALRRKELAQASARIFSQVWNPTSARTGNKILRERPMAEHHRTYHPKPLGSLQEFRTFVDQDKARLRALGETRPEILGFNPELCGWSGLELVNTSEAERLEKLDRARRRGKGTPKKGQGKKVSIKKKK